jgi:hypothetical protein
MRISRAVSGFLVLCLIILMTGCTKRYLITDELSDPLIDEPACSIGPVTDELPIGFDEADKPAVETIDRFKDYIYEELAKREIFSALHRGSGMGDYEVTGGILDYKKGSGFLRFMFGAWAGGAKVTVSLRLVNTRTNKTEFGGDFTGSVTHWAEKGEQMFKQVAVDFAKQLEKQIKNLKKKKERSAG